MVPRRPHFGFLRLALLGLVLAVTALPARADDFAVLVTALGSDTFTEKEKAITGLGGLGDPRAVPVLQALSDDRLRIGPNGQVLLVTPGSGGSALVDAASGEPVADVAVKDTGRIIVNNRLRGNIDAAMGGLTLFSSDRSTRLAAARDALKHPSVDGAARLIKAM